MKAEEYLTRTLAISKEIVDRKGENLAYGHLGTVCQCLGKHVEAKEYLTKALEISKEIGDKKDRSHILRKPWNSVAISR